MKMSFISAFVFLTCLARGQQVLLTRSGHGVLEEMRYIDESNLTSDEYLRQAANDFLTKHPDVQVRHLILLTDIRDVSSLRLGRTVSDISYTMWKDRYIEWGSKISPQAELLSFGGASAIRVRTRDGSIRYIVLTAKNPFEFTFKHQHMQIDFVAFKESSPYLKPMLQVTFFVQGAVRSEQQAEAVYHFLHSVLKTPNIETRIATDPWFVDSSDYPWANPYLKAGTIPSYEQYAKVTTFICEHSTCTGLRAVAAH